MSLKYFKLLSFIFFAFCSMVSSINATPSVSFIKPVNGSIVYQGTGAGTQQTTVPVPVEIGYSGQTRDFFIKLFAGPTTYNTYEGDVITTHINLAPGSYDWRVEL